jgi:hypothetical protein
MPVVAAKYVSFLLVALELVDPQVPEALFTPPSVRLLTVRVSPAPMLAVADPVGAILRLPVVKMPPAIDGIDLAPLPDRIRLVYVVARTGCAPE